MSYTEIPETINLIDKIYHKYSEIFSKKSIIAYSGGKDSTVLLFIYIYLYKNKNIPEPIIFHLNHSIRDNIQQEEEISIFLENLHLQNICITKKVKTISKKIKKSLEETGRLVRYHEMLKISLKNSAIIVTGHHTQDYLESILINFIRGGGESALTTIPLFDKNLFRPLILFSEKERKILLELSKFPIFEDESNYSKDFLRNRIRLDIIEKLKTEGLDTQKLYFNFHSTDLKDEPYNSRDYYSIHHLGLRDFNLSQLKKLLDLYLRQLNVHPIKKKILLEIYDLIKKSKKVVQENSEVIFWKSPKSNLFIIKKKSDCLKAPRIIDGTLHWNKNIYKLKANESVINYKAGMKIKKNHQSHKVSELLRCEGIPEPVRNYFPILLYNLHPHGILFNLWDTEKKNYIGDNL